MAQSKRDLFIMQLKPGARAELEDLAARLQISRSEAARCAITLLLGSLKKEKSNGKK
jgi:hypothetical protein